MRRAALPLLVLLVLAAPLGGCGGDDDGGGEASPSAAPHAGGAAAGGHDDGLAPRDAPGAGDASAGGSAGNSAGGEDGGGTDGEPAGGVDLTVDPARIDGARVTATGAVQTLPPRERAHRTAEENGYSSINSFGEEATGEEATDITFALVQYLNAKVEGDWATACARLYGLLRENLERSSGGKPCPEAFGALVGRVPKATLAEQARIDVSSVRRGEGGRAFVVYKTPQTLSADMPMYDEGGVWKVGALEAYALSPDQVG